MQASKFSCRKRFMTVDTMGLVLRVLVTAASVPEREGGKQVLKLVLQMNKGVSRLHTMWADGGFDGNPFMMWVMDVYQWIVQVVLRRLANQRVRVTQKKVGGRTNVWLVDGVSPSR
jgi:transposase